MLEIGCDLQVLARREAPRFLMSRSRGDLVRWLLSIGDPGGRPPAGFHRPAHRLRLEFEDDDESRSPFAPDRNDVERIIRFASHFPDDGIAIVHCDAGVSRSPAAAIITLKARYADTAETEIVQAVLALRAGARPNRRLIELADDLLGCEGRLSRAVRETGPPGPPGR